MRPGYISVEDLSEFTKVYIDKGIINKVENDRKVMSPGMKYKHYSPKANVIILDGDLEKYIDYVTKNYTKDTWCVVFDDEKSSVKLPSFTYGKGSKQEAKQLFDVLRELDKVKAKTAYFRCPKKEGIGLAVYNRLLRAAGFEVVKL